MKLNDEAPCQNIYCYREKRAVLTAMCIAGVGHHQLIEERKYYINHGDNMNPYFINEAHADSEKFDEDSDSYFNSKIYDRGKHIDIKLRYVAIVKHKYGHFKADAKELSQPHLHVYKVDASGPNNQVLTI